MHTLAASKKLGLDLYNESCMKKFNYINLARQIEVRKQELEALHLAKEQEKEQELIPHRINSKTVVLSKSNHKQLSGC